MDERTDGQKNNLQNLKCKIEVNTNKTSLFFLVFETNQHNAFHVKI